MNLKKSLAWCGDQLLRINAAVAHRPVIRRRYNGKQLLSAEEANEKIGKALESKVPFMAGRYGSCELAALWRVRDSGKGTEGSIAKATEQLHFNAGFFPMEKDAVIQFAEEMKRASHEVDLMGIWNQPMEAYELRTWGNDPDYCTLKGLEPFFVKDPWTKHLEGKKVLVIHPFAETIERQYSNRRRFLFPNPDILPEFTLITQKAVQTIAGNRDSRFHTWFDALKYMEEEALEKSFDVAVIGCGAYGFPLAARLKKAGHRAVHLGGAAQLLFGIKGKRWESREDYAVLMNDSWVKASEKPMNADRVEGGCYW